MNEMISLFDNLEIERSESGDRAVKLHMEILHNNAKAAEYLGKMCFQIKEMRDTQLYRSLGFESFENYTETALKIKSRQAYSYIRVAEKLGGEYIEANAQLGVTKLALLADILPDEREELAEQSDLQEVSVRELKAKIEELKERTKQLSFLEEENAELRQELSGAAGPDVDELERKIAELEDENRRLNEEKKDAGIPDDVYEKIKSDIVEEVRAAEREAAEEKVKKAVDKATAAAQKDIEEQKNAAAAEAVEKLRESLDKIEKEKALAIERAEEFRKKLEISENSDMVTFKYLFEECQERFNKMLNFLKDTKKKDAETYAKLQGAVVALIGQLKGIVEAG